MACLWRGLSLQGLWGGGASRDWALLAFLGVQAMVEPQRSGWRSPLQVGALPALSSILTPFPSVELAPSQLLPSGGLEDQGLGARSLEAFCSAPLFPLVQFTVTRPPWGGCSLYSVYSCSYPHLARTSLSAL